VEGKEDSERCKGKWNRFRLKLLIT
jgi:hypothetical protein